MSERQTTHFLLLLAALMLPAFVFYNFIIPQTPGRLARPSRALIAEFWLWQWPLPLPARPLETGMLLLLVVTICVVLYAGGVYLLWRVAATRGRITAVFLTTLLFWLTSLLAVPTVSTDIFNYMVRGRITAVYGENPYYTPADTFPDDPIYPYASHRYTGVAGGKFPAWMLLNIGLAWLGRGGGPVQNLFLYRGALLLLNVANFWLIGRILQRLAPERRLAGLLFYGWNPIVVIFGQSKTDTVMVFGLLLGVWLLLHERSRWGMVALAFSGWVKLLTLPLTAVYLADQLWRRRWRAFLSDSLLFGLASLALYLPFLRDLDPILGAVFVVSSGGPPPVGEVAASGSSWPQVVALGFLGLWGLAVWGQNGRLSRLLVSWVWLILYFSLFLAEPSLSWYLLTLIALVSIVQNRFFLAVGLALSGAVFFRNSWSATFSSAFPAPELALSLLPLVLLALSGGLVLVLFCGNE